MSNSQNSGNPAIGMQGNTLEAASENASQKVSSKAPKSGSKEFFDSLDQEVNGQIIDNKATPTQPSGPAQVTHNRKDEGSNRVVEQSHNSTDWQKRYTDSSREAVKWRDKFKTVEPFVPVLEAMKNDSGLVDHVRGYLQSGGKPAASIQEKLDIPEDFIFDQQEAMTNPDSDSAKLMNAHVDTLVEKRVGSMVQNERVKNQKIAQAKTMKDQEIAFMEKNKMSKEDFAIFKDKAKSHKMTLDDVNYVLNRDKVSANVAQSTKKDMLNQMKNTRNMPTTASGANSQGSGHKSQDREVFENILGFDSGTDNLFG
jgi:hypothetical protein